MPNREIYPDWDPTWTPEHLQLLSDRELERCIRQCESAFRDGETPARTPNASRAPSKRAWHRLAQRELARRHPRV